MRRCPRCRSTMLFEFGGSVGASEWAWKCVGCGREVLADALKQAEDDQLLSQLGSTATRHENL
jgi:transposase-like protein